MEPKDKYKELADAEGLPPYDALRHEFDFHLEEDSDIPVTILHSVRDRVGYYAKIVEELLQPEASTSALHECKEFDDRKGLYDLYKRLMKLDRTLLEADIRRENEIHAIKEAWNSWDGLKSEILGIVSKMRDAWNNDQTEDDRLEYFG